jgi:hypothetical protein
VEGRLTQSLDAGRHEEEKEEEEVEGKRWKRPTRRTVEVLDSARQAADAALSDAGDSSTNRVTLARSVGLKELDGSAKEIEDGNDETSEGL